MKQAPPPTDDEVELEESTSPETSPQTIGRQLIPEEKMWFACLMERAKRPSYFKTQHFVDTCELLGINPDYIKRRMQ